MMYNLLLGLNIFFEIALAMLPWLLVLGLGWLALVVGVARSPAAQFKKMLPATLLVAALATIVMAVLLLAIEGGGLGDLAYFVDWLFLLGSALGAGVVVALIAWPVLAWLGGRRTVSPHRAASPGRNAA